MHVKPLSKLVGSNIFLFSLAFSLIFWLLPVTSRAQTYVAEAGFSIGTGFNSWTYPMVELPQKKILVGGNFTIFNGTPANRIISLNADGSVNNTMNFGTGFDSWVSSIAIDNNNKILIGGFFTAYNGATANRIVRLNSNGSIDNSFITGTGFNGTVRKIIVNQSTGKIVVGGDFTQYNGIQTGRLVVLNNDGSLDQSVTIGLLLDKSVYDIQFDNTGRILIGGNFSLPTAYLLRLNANGTIDNSFNTNLGLNDYVWSIRVDQSGRILIGGLFTGKLRRLDANGYNDLSFSIGTGLNNLPYTIQVAQDSKILVGGLFTIYNGSNVGCLVRINENGSLDDTFNMGNKPNSTILSILPFDEDYLMGGDFISFSGKSINRFARLREVVSLNVYNVTANSKVYDGTTTASINTSSAFLSGYRPGETVTINTASASATFDNKNVGDRTVTFSGFALGGTHAANYTLAQQPGSVTVSITPKPITLTADVKTKVYGDPDPTFTYTVSPALISGDSFTGALSRVAGGSVGTYAINSGNLSNSNYSITFNGANLDIIPKPITVTAEPKSKVYGDADPALTYTFSPALLIGDSFTGSLARVAGGNAGVYGINQNTLTAGSNYSINYTSADFTIEPKPITVTAQAKSKVYGDADPALTYTFSPALLSGDSFAGVLSRTAGASVGNYVINQNTLSAGSNYSINYNSANLSITAKPITVTAEAKAKVYGDPDPTFTYQVAPSLLAGDSFTGALSRAAGSNIGTYAINIGNLSNSNYSITFNSANLSITAKPVTVTAEAKAKIYGDEDPTFTYTVSPVLISGDSFTGALSRVAGNNVGTYAINIGNLSNSNYSITFNSANLTINKKPITVKADPKSKVYGTNDPALTYTVAPALVSGDSFSAGSLVRSAGENAGTYSISEQTAFTAGNNYTVTFEKANFVINKADQTVTFDAIPDKTVNDAAFSLSASASTSSPITFSTNSDKVSISENKVTLLKAGKVSITATQAGTSNFNSATATRVFCIKPAKPVISAVFSNPTSPVLSSSNVEGNQWFLNAQLIPNSIAQTHVVAQPGNYTVQTKADDCVSLPSDNYSVVITGDIELDQNDGVSLSPNPVVNRFELRITSAQSVFELFTIDGQKLEIPNVREKDYIVYDASSLPSGVYFIKVVDPKENRVIRFVKR